MIKVYTDGSVHPNPGSGGYAMVLLGTPERDPIRFAGSSSNTTSNRMEMSAVIMAFLWLEINHPKEHATIYSDSRYVVDGFNKWSKDWAAKGWKVNKKNLDMWQRLRKLGKANPLVAVEWIEGHAGDPGNELADTVAEGARRSGIVAPEWAVILPPPGPVLPATPSRPLVKSSGATRTPDLVDPAFNKPKGQVDKAYADFMKKRKVRNVREEAALGFSGESGRARRHGSARSNPNFSSTNPTKKTGF